MATLVTHLRFQRRRASSATEAALASLVLAFLAFGGRHTWFFGDDWAFVLDRQELLDQGRIVDFLLGPHNEHLSSLPILLYTAIFRIFGVDSYAPYLVCALLAHGGVLWGVRTLLHRLDAPAGWRLVAIVWLGFGAGGAENLLWAFQVGFVGAIAAGIWAVILVFTGAPSLRRDIGAAVLCGVGFLTASTVVPLVAATAVVLVRARAYRRLAIVVVAPGLPLLLWYLLIGRARAPQVAHPESVMPQFFTTGLTFTFDRIVGVGTVGVLVGAGAFVLLRSRTRSGTRQLDIIDLLFLTPLITFALAAYSRSYLGLEGAKASRYAYAAAVTLVPALTLSAQHLWRSHRQIRPVIGLCLAVALGASASNYVAFRAGWKEFGQNVRPTLELAPLLASAPLADPDSPADPYLTPNATRRRLQQLIETGRWEPRTPWTAEVRAEVSLRAGVTQRDDVDLTFDRADEPRAVPRTGSLERTYGDGCWRSVTAWPDESVHIDLGTRGLIELTWPTDSVVLRIVDADGTELAMRPIDLSNGTTIGFETLVGSVELVAPGPRVEFCAVANPRFGDSPTGGTNDRDR
ncbi:MAG: hypothetical protein FJW83_08535 [Actinobacteria bacterium]|nr:hypothetical protein [Actinomycetota bacterium]